jgi:exosortase/archaeosortase family protein
VNTAKSILNHICKSFKDSNMLAIILKSVTLILSVIGIYFHDLSLIFADALQYEASSHVLILPVLIAYLIYRKRKVIIANIQNDEIVIHQKKLFNITAGFLLCLIASMIYVYGSQTFTPSEYHILTLPIFVSGLILIMFNPKTLREMIVPVGFAVFFVPPPSVILNNLGFVLSVGSSGIANALVNVLGIKSWISIETGTPIINVIAPGNQPISFAIDVACSGIYSLIAFLVFSVFVAYIVRDKIWKKITVFLIGFPIIYALNILRISVIILIGYHWGPHLALEIFHQLGGWIFLIIGTIMLLVITEKVFKVKFFVKKAVDTKSSIDFSWIRQQYHMLIGKTFEESRKKFRIFDAGKIIGLMLITLCVISIQSPLFTPTQGPAAILVQSNGKQRGNVALFPSIENYTLRFIYRDTDFEEISGQDFSLAYEYVPQNEADLNINLLLEVADTISPLHRWEGCLVEWRVIVGEEPVSVLDLKDVELFENPIIMGRYFAFYNNNRIQLVLYWFEKAVFNINDDMETKYVKISLVVFFDDPENLSSMEGKLLPIAQSIVSYWRTSATWNVILLFLSKTSFHLASIFLFMFIALLIINSIQTMNKRKKNNVVYQKLSDINKLVVDSVKETQNSMVPTLDNIAMTYNKKLNQLVKTDQLLKYIMQLEKLELIKNQIINNQDEPVQTWITCI